MSNDNGVAVIIPAYNVEKYLERCVGSVLAQDYPASQIILTDDGSTDATGAICDRYAAEYPQVTVVHQKNAGVSAARNAALKKVTCGYFVFLDADDALQKNALKVLAEEQEKYPGGFIAADRLLMIKDNSGGYRGQKRDGIPKWTVMNSEGARKELCTGRYGLQSACHKLFRTKLAQGLEFETGIDNGEDRLFVYGYLRRCESVVFVPEGLWEVYTREESASHRPPDMRWFGMIRVMDRLVREEPSPGIRRGYRVHRMELLVLYIAAYLWRKSRDKEFYRELRRCTRQGIGEYRKDGASRHDVAAARFFGYAPTPVLRLYIRIRGKEI